MFKFSKKSFFAIFGVLFTLIGMSGINQLEQPQHVEAALQLKGGHWASKTITYSINPGTEQTVASAWINAANEINRYGIVNFVQTTNGVVKLGQQVASDSAELGIAQTWRRGNEYSRAVAYLSVNQSLKNSEGRNYAQRKYATALHELGHVLGLKHDTNPNGLMYPMSSSSFRTIDGTVLAALVQLYGPSTTGYTGYTAARSTGYTQPASNQTQATQTYNSNNGSAAVTNGNTVTQGETSNELINGKTILEVIASNLKKLNEILSARRIQFENSLLPHKIVRMTSVK